jgi:hypothetical protein
LFPVSIKSSLFRVVNNLTEANWADVESELLSRVTSIQSSDVFDWHSGGGFGINLHNGLVPAGRSVATVTDELEVWVSRVEFGFTGASEFEVGLTVLAVVADGLSSSGGQ